MPGWLARALPALLGAVALAWAPDSFAGSYVYTTIDVPGGTGTFPAAINNDGEVAGSFLTAQPSGEAGFVWNAGQLRQVILGHSTLLMGINGAGLAVGSDGANSAYDALIYRSYDGRILRPLRSQAASAQLTAINDRNVVAGYFGTGLLTTGFLLHDGALTEVRSPDGAATQMLGIDNAGVSYGQELRHYRWFTYRDGIVKFLPLPPGTIVSGIGQNGKLSGSLADTGDRFGSSAFVYDGGPPVTFRWRGVLGGQRVAADYNEAVGATPLGVFGNYGFAVQGGTSAGFVKRGDVFYTLNPPGSTYTRIVAVNTRGAFVGFYDTGAFGHYVEHGFIATCPADQAPCTK